MNNGGALLGNQERRWRCIVIVAWSSRPLDIAYWLRGWATMMMTDSDVQVIVIVVVAAHCD
jgi:hypothetical protein